MPWLAIPFTDARVKELYKKFDIIEVPTIMVLDRNQNIVMDDATNMI